MPTAPASTIKQQAHALIDQLPDTATWHDMAAALALVEDIEAGLADSDAERVMDTATLRKHFGITE